MQEAVVVLDVLRERGRKGLPFTQLYRQMFNKELYLLAYGNIYSNQGAMTPGASAETADGMSEDKIDQIIEAMRHERYRFSPARRVYIPKKNEKLRPLGMPSWSDKLVGEVVRLLLEAIYEPRFSNRSHGFRKGRGCHTALREIHHTWSGTTWFIEGDISDKFVEQELIPQYTRGALRAANPAYRQTDALLRRARRRGDRAEARHLMKQMRMLPSTDPMDPGYRRLRYVRYADDHLLGFTGPRAEAEQIKARLAEFLRETLGLELNDSKTLISHARTQPARFLGYDIIVQHSSTKITRNRRSVNGRIALRVPPDVVKAQCARYRQRGKPSRRTRLQNQDDYDIVRVYAAEYRGVVNYYLLAQDVWRLRTLRWNAETSMLKTLAAKHKSTATKMAARFRAKVTTSDGLRTCFEARRKRRGKPDLVARFGGIILRQDRRAVIKDPAPVPVRVPRKELLARLRQRVCELCETGTTVAVHQVAALRQLGKPGPDQPAWATVMARMRRKTLIVCAPCHDWIHAKPVAHAA